MLRWRWRECLGAIADSVSGKNRLINGNFELWQRGDNFTAAAAYCADRFFAQHGGMDGAVIFKSPVAPGDSNFPRSLFTLAANCNGNHNGRRTPFPVRAACGKCADLCRIGEQAILPGLQRRHRRQKDRSRVPAALRTGGSPTVTAIQPEVFNARTGPEPDQQDPSVFLPSTVRRLAVAMIRSSVRYGSQQASDFNARTGGSARRQASLYFGEMQWEAGARATRFEWRSPAHELALCQRYYQKSFPVTEVPNSRSSSAVHRNGRGLQQWYLPRCCRVSKARCAARQSCCSMQAEKVVTSDRRASGGTTTPRVEHGARER